MILDEVCRDVLSEVRRLRKDFRVIDAAVGIKYTYVMIEDLSTSEYFIGLSYTPSEDIARLPLEVFSVKGVEVSRLCGLVTSENFVSRALGMAALNALTSAITEVPNDAKGIDVLDLMPLGKEDVVAVVGYITPLIDPLRRRVKEVHVFERDQLRRRDALPDTLLPRVLRGVSAAIISGAALLNDTLDSIIEWVGPGTKLALVGATGSVKPEPLFRAGIHYVAGFRVDSGEEATVAELVRLGAGTKEIYKHGYKYVLSKD